MQVMDSTSNGCCVKVEPVLGDCESTSSLAVETTSFYHEFKLSVDEMSLQYMLKHESEEVENANTAGWVSSSQPTACKSVKGEDLQSYTRDNTSLPKVPSTGKKKCKSKCESNEFQDFTLLKCPACDKTFKGGKRRVPSLVQHVDSTHYKQRKRLTSIITKLWTY